MAGVNSGLEGVVVAETVLSDVDGEAGRLVVAGRSVEALAGAETLEGVAAHLWRLGAASPGGPSAEEVRRALGAARVAAAKRRRSRGSVDVADGMDALRAAVAQEQSGGDDWRAAAELAGAVAVHAAAWACQRRGVALSEPDPARGHAEDYLRMVLGRDPGAALGAGMDAYLVTVADHGMNASTFTARVVASTGSDMVSAVVAAIGALKGPLHGGAPGPVLDMLEGVGRPEEAEGWLEAELAAGRRIMGMGHRIYRVRDPRAAVLERALVQLERAGVRTGRLALARAVESAAEGVLRKRHPDRPLRANVEFYTAVLLDTLGVDRAVFSPTFAVGRVVGWCAHVMEQRRTGRLIRPASSYVGEIPHA